MCTNGGGLCVFVADDADIAELDGGQAATVTFPEVNDLTHFDVKVQSKMSAYCDVHVGENVSVSH